MLRNKIDGEHRTDTSRCNGSWRERSWTNFKTFLKRGNKSELSALANMDVQSRGEDRQMSRQYTQTVERTKGPLYANRVALRPWTEIQTYPKIISRTSRGSLRMGATRDWTSLRTEFLINWRPSWRFFTTDFKLDISKLHSEIFLRSAERVCE